MRRPVDTIFKVLSVLFLICPLLPAMADTPEHFIVEATGGGTAFKPVPLNGDWLFAWDRFLTPQQARAEFEADALPAVPVPSDWEDHLPDEPHPRHGRATYITHLKMPAEPLRDLVLTLPVLRDAYRVIWVPLDPAISARLITEQGTLDGPIKAAPRDLSVPFAETGDGLLVVHLRKALLSRGGITSTPYVTTLVDAKSKLTISFMMFGIAIGGLIIISLKNLLLLASTPNDKAVILMSALAIAATLRTTADSDIIETLFGTQWHVLRMRLEIATIPIIGSVGLALHQVLLPRKFRFAVHKPIHLIGAALAVFFACAPKEALYQWLPAAQVYMFIVVSPAILHIVHGWRKRETGIVSIVAAAAFSVVATAHDVIASRLVDYGVFIGPLSIILLVAVYGQVVQRRAAEAVERTRVLELEQIDLRRKHSAALHKSRHDHLTGLQNRQAFDSELTAAWNDMIANSRPLALVIFDIDHFKPINDTHGHPVGDSVLKALAERLTGFNLRKSDRLCRYGGEEFALILPDTTAEEAMGLAEHLRRAIADTPILPDALRLSITCSFGIAATDTTDASTEHALLDAADKALYTAKSKGRNCVSTDSALRAA